MSHNHDDSDSEDGDYAPDKVPTKSPSAPASQRYDSDDMYDHDDTIYNSQLNDLLEKGQLDALPPDAPPPGAPPPGSRGHSQERTPAPGYDLRIIVSPNKEKGCTDSIQKAIAARAKRKRPLPAPDEQLAASHRSDSRAPSEAGAQSHAHARSPSQARSHSRAQSHSRATSRVPSPRLNPYLAPPIQPHYPPPSFAASAKPPYHLGPPMDISSSTFYHNQSSNGSNQYPNYGGMYNQYSGPPGAPGPPIAPGPLAASGPPNAPLIQPPPKSSIRPPLKEIRVPASQVLAPTVAADGDEDDDDDGDWEDDDQGPSEDDSESSSDSGDDSDDDQENQPCDEPRGKKGRLSNNSLAIIEEGLIKIDSLFVDLALAAGTSVPYVKRKWDGHSGRRNLWNDFQAVLKTGDKKFMEKYVKGWFPGRRMTLKRKQASYAHFLKKTGARAPELLANILDTNLMSVPQTIQKRQRAFRDHCKHLRRLVEHQERIQGFQTIIFVVGDTIELDNRLGFSYVSDRLSSLIEECFFQNEETLLSIIKAASFDNVRHEIMAKALKSFMERMATNQPLVDVIRVGDLTENSKGKDIDKVLRDSILRQAESGAGLIWKVIPWVGMDAVASDKGFAVREYPHDVPIPGEVSSTKADRKTRGVNGSLSKKHKLKMVERLEHPELPMTFQKLTAREHEDMKNGLYPYITFTAPPHTSSQTHARRVFIGGRTDHLGPARLPAPSNSVVPTVIPAATSSARAKSAKCGQSTSAAAASKPSKPLKPAGKSATKSKPKKKSKRDPLDDIDPVLDEADFSDGSTTVSGDDYTSPAKTRSKGKKPMQSSDTNAADETPKAPKPKHSAASATTSQSGGPQDASNLKRSSESDAPGADPPAAKRARGNTNGAVDHSAANTNLPVSVEPGPRAPWVNYQQPYHQGRYPPVGYPGQHNAYRPGPSTSYQPQQYNPPVQPSESQQPNGYAPHFNQPPPPFQHPDQHNGYMSQPGGPNAYPPPPSGPGYPAPHYGGYHQFNGPQSSYNHAYPSQESYQGPYNGQPEEPAPPAE
ncbi:hypothetical protein C8J56DRAFT_898370 [Mycena floridula]|nr:hypothetical protein C8J56DRAFT_898370 [Mycena floridula]